MDKLTLEDVLRFIVFVLFITIFCLVILGVFAGLVAYFKTMDYKAMRDLQVMSSLCFLPIFCVVIFAVLVGIAFVIRTR